MKALRQVPEGFRSGGIYRDRNGFPHATHQGDMYGPVQCGQSATLVAGSWQGQGHKSLSYFRCSIAKIPHPPRMTPIRKSNHPEVA